VEVEVRLGDFPNHPNALAMCWAFARGDIEPSTFESWLYSDRIAEMALGPDLFLETVSADFDSTYRVADLRDVLSKILPSPAPCSCHTIPNYHLTTIGMVSLDNFDLIERGTPPRFWLHRFGCRQCGTEWCLAEESRIYDVWILVRGWIDLPDAQTYRDLLALAVRLGASVQYLQAEMSVEIPVTIEELAKETPGITLSLSTAKSSNVSQSQYSTLNHIIPCCNQLHSNSVF
jgi:hypothetical protein